MEAGGARCKTRHARSVSGDQPGRVLGCLDQPEAPTRELGLGAGWVGPLLPLVHSRAKGDGGPGQSIAFTGVLRTNL